ncbi:MAG: OB-fold domain-containing protein [Candidatus Rokubacteria bacterium]|nr:OB-fold domain-containing protein [Candidatus Rokubacteria bacterium]
MIREAIDAGRCPTCRRLVVPPAAHCPDDAARMEHALVSPVGEVMSFTTLHSPPEGFRSPLHIALVELEGGARLFCHGEATQGMRIGSRVSVEELDSVFYFSHLSFADRARLFWRRAGARGEKATAISRAVVKGLFKGKARGQD